MRVSDLSSRSQSDDGWKSSYERAGVEGSFISILSLPLLNAKRGYGYILNEIARRLCLGCVYIYIYLYLYTRRNFNSSSWADRFPSNRKEGTFLFGFSGHELFCCLGLCFGSLVILTSGMGNPNSSYSLCYWHSCADSDCLCSAKE